jgi:hypothetical protein
VDNIKIEEFCLLEYNACSQLKVNRHFVDFQRTTRSYIPEDRALYNHRYENLKSYTMLKLMLNLESVEVQSKFK